MNRAAARLGENPSAAAGIGATYKFILTGDGGGTWIAALTTNPAITEGDAPADCTLKLAASDYVDLLEGRAEAGPLFFAGKLQIDGDMALAMKLGTLTSLLS